jgi:N6-L-threonylcarbamoyladenine synthase
MLILGIETSCDETAAAVVRDGREVLSSIVATQDKLHIPYGGVVPEIACRAHLLTMLPVLHRALEEAKARPEEVGAVATVNAPGLVGSLLIGVTAAKTFAWLRGLPLVGVNHLHAHIYAAALDRATPVFPCVSLVASGGHTSLFHSRSPLEHEPLGATRDDAAGETFDKAASILGLGYPGGPAVDRAARTGDRKAVRFPRTRLEADSLDFSFSGVKTSVLYHCRGQDGKTARDMKPQEIADVAASFQEAVVQTLTAKVMAAVERTGAERVAVGGGVAANSRLREELQSATQRRGVELLLPPMKFCIDNGAMVAGLAWHLFNAGRTSDLWLDACPTEKARGKAGVGSREKHVGQIGRV